MQTVINLLPFAAGLIALAVGASCQKRMLARIIDHFSTVEPTLELELDVIKSVAQRFIFDSDYLLAVTSAVTFGGTGLGLWLGDAASLAGVVGYCVAVTLFAVFTLRVERKYSRHPGVYKATPLLGVSILTAAAIGVNLIGAAVTGLATLLGFLLGK